MKRFSSTNSIFLSSFLLITTILTFQGCKDSGTNTTPPDFSSVPAPYDTTAALERDVRENGLIIYILEEGNNIFKVSQRDWISVYYTGRTTDGEVFGSTYRDGNTIPSAFYNLTNSTSTGPDGVSTFQPLPLGLREGLLNMSIGERRTLVVPPNLGYVTVPISGQLSISLRNDTLIYDIELVDILF